MCSTVTPGDAAVDTHDNDDDDVSLERKNKTFPPAGSERASVHRAPSVSRSA